jgi:branched-chain amino acid transport system ATP-binding protein
MTSIENLLIPPRNQFGTNPFTGLASFFIPDEERRRVRKAYQTLDELEIRHMAHNLTSELSGGQSKLVDIGRALMGNPLLLLLDEPVAGVAGPLAEKIFNNLRKIVDDKGISILVIEHNMDFILRHGVDRIVVMDQGRVLMQGSPDEVKDSKEVIEAYLGGAK